MGETWDANWYFEHVLADASPGGPDRLPTLPVEVWQHWWQRAARGDRIVRAAAQQGFVLAPARLADPGVSRSSLRTALARGRWYSPARGAVAPLDLTDASRHVTARRQHAVRATAAVLRRPGHVVGARSATILHGLPTLDVPDRPELTVRDDGRLGRTGTTHAFGATLPASAVTVWFGAPVTTAARTVVDLARHDRRDGLMAADAALRERLVTPTILNRALDEAAGWPGVRQARALLALATPLAESPLESITRLALHDAGFPPPELQQWVGASRVDFVWPRQRLILEADGRGKYVGDALWAEKRREHGLRTAGGGYAVERVLWSDVVSTWPATEARLRRYFAA